MDVARWVCKFYKECEREVKRINGACVSGDRKCVLLMNYMEARTHHIKGDVQTIKHGAGDAIRRFTSMDSEEHKEQGK